MIALAMHKTYLLVATIDIPLLVFDTRTAKLLGQSSVSSSNAVSCVRLLNDMNRFTNVRSAHGGTSNTRTNATPYAGGVSGVNFSPKKSTTHNNENGINI